MWRYERAGWVIAALSIVSIAGPVQAAENRCERLLPRDTASRSQGPVTAETLATLRDIGPGSPDRTHELFALSPNQNWVAFQLHQADVVTNGYCVGIVVLPLATPSRAQILDHSQELILDRRGNYGWAAFPLGAPAPITPRWAPNGHWIAYLKRLKGSTQVWKVNIDGSGISQLTHSGVDVDDFRISSDGLSLIYAARPGLTANEAAIDEEGLRGWHYDERAFPVRGPRPQTPDADRRFMAIDIETGAEREASAGEAAVFEKKRTIFANNTVYAEGPNGFEAWAEATDSSLAPPDYRLVVARGGNIRSTCPSSLCKLDISSSIWWTRDAKRVRFTRREGWANSLTGIYEWAPGAHEARRVYLTSDALIGCQPLGNDLLCLRERSLEPRHFVRLEFDKGKHEKLFDPNPEFAHFTVGRVERLNWRNDFGVPFYGDLVYPVDYRRGRRYPLVVVQYRTKGFLRGGIGDEVPIQAFANQGYFVLVADNLTYWDIVGRQKSWSELDEAFNRNFAGRRNILSAIEVAIRSLVAKGLINQNEIGITGLSDGCTTVQFASIQSFLFSAGSLNGCGWEPIQDAFLGPMVAQTYHRSGWPRIIDRNSEVWPNISLLDQPNRVKFPLLFQAADNEYLSVVASYTALMQAGVPSDLFIFPDENHLKSQPLHRLAVYRRNLNWFNFWLKGDLPTIAIEREEAERWVAMKAKWTSLPGTNVRSRPSGLPELVQPPNSSPTPLHPEGP